MGLAIYGMYSDKEYRFSYGALHLVRFLAIKVAGYEGTIKDFNETYLSRGLRDDTKEIRPIWDDYPDFYQLLHFSDAEGMLVGEWVLRNVEYKHSFNLGNLNKLAEELETIKDAIARHPERYSDESLNTWASKPFWALYDLVSDELEQGGCLQFC